MDKVLLSPANQNKSSPDKSNKSDIRKATFVTGNGAKVQASDGSNCFDLVSHDVILGHKNAKVNSILLWILWN